MRPTCPITLTYSTAAFSQTRSAPGNHQTWMKFRSPVNVIHCWSLRNCKGLSKQMWTVWESSLYSIQRQNCFKNEGNTSLLSSSLNYSFLTLPPSLLPRKRGFYKNCTILMSLEGRTVRIWMLPLSFITYIILAIAVSVSFSVKWGCY